MNDTQKQTGPVTFDTPAEPTIPDTTVTAEATPTPEDAK